MASDPERLRLVIGLFFASLGLLWWRSARVRAPAWPLVILAVLSGWPLVVNLADPRVVTFDQSGTIGTLEMGEWSSALQIPAWIVTGLFAVYAAKSLLATRSTGLPSAGRRLLFSFLLFACSPILSALFGDPGGGLTHALVRPHLVMVCVFFAANADPERFIRASKWACAAYVLASLVAGAVAPGWAFAQSSSISGGPLPFPRLYGVASNPNALAPVALMLLFLEYYDPSARVVRLAVSSAALVVVILAQSKTVWIIALFSGFVLLVHRRGSTMQSRSQTNARRAVLAAVFFSAVLAAAAFGGTALEAFEGSSLTGRTALWEISLEEWKAKPLLGYGPTLWDERFRRERLGGEAAFAGHSHNMYVQQLAESGALGFALMLAFLTVMATAAWNLRLRTGGLSLALLFFVLIRGMTEGALSLRSLDESMFVGALAFALLIVLERRSRRVVTPAGAGANATRPVDAAFARPPHGSPQPLRW